ncbi:MAG: hypothetical protein HY698_19605 [Deltaproteobacteria bacterium]|nr:hypothetical protein [Deltaproteobacteria bacterium]
MIVAAALAMAVAACHRPGPRLPRREIRLHLEAEPAHLNPLLSGDALSVKVTLGDVYEPLVTFSREGHVIPILAETWQRTDGDREWTFSLRKGVTWHDGAPLVVADVLFTFALLAPDKAPTPLSADFDDIESVEPLGSRGVRVRFRGFRVGRDRTLARVPILPAHVFRAAPAEALASHPQSRAPVGTGPFQLEGQVPGREIRLRRFSRYWGPAPRVDHVIYRIIPDRTQAVAQLEAGLIDMVAQVPAGEAEELARGGKLALLAYDAPTFLAVTWNCRKGPLADARARRALTQLLDRETIVREIFQGRARVQSGPWAPSDPSNDTRIAPWPHDPTAARKLLEEAGALPLSVRILYPQSSVKVERLATIWQEDARQVGVILILEPAPFDVVVKRAQAGDFDGVALSWLAEHEQDFFHKLHSSVVGEGNDAGIRDAEMDRLLEAVRTTPDPNARSHLARKLHARLHELQPMTIVVGDMRTALVSRRLRGVTPDGIFLPARHMFLSE